MKLEIVAEARYQSFNIFKQCNDHNLSALYSACDYFLKQYHDITLKKIPPTNKGHIGIMAAMANGILSDLNEKHTTNADQADSLIRICMLEQHNALDMSVYGIRSSFTIELPYNQWAALFADPKFKQNVLPQAILMEFASTIKVFAFVSEDKSFLAYKQAHYILSRLGLDFEIEFDQDFP